MKTRLYSTWFIAAIVFAFSQPSTAQDFYSSSGYSNYINTLITNSIWNSSMERYAKGHKGNSRTSTLNSVNISPQDKAEVKALVLDIFKKYEAEAAAKGYPNDWALAFVSYVGLNSHVYNGKTEPLILPFEQNIGLRDVVAENATGKGIFNNVTDAKKQELYELLVMLGGLTYHFYEKALKENNAEELKNSKLAAAQNLKLVGITRSRRI